MPTAHDARLIDLDIISPARRVEQRKIDALTDADWTEILRLARQHRIGPMMRWQLRRARAPQPLSCTRIPVPAYALRAYAFNSRTKALARQMLQHMGIWLQHVLNWADAPGLVCTVIRYGDMLRHPLATFTRAVQFLRASDDPARIERALEFSRFDTLAQMERERGFRERPPRTSSFFRQGATGGWRDTLTPQQVRAIIDAHAPAMRRFGYLDERGKA